MAKERYNAAARFIAGIVGTKNDLTKTQLQKICYLLQEMGQSDTKFRFIMYHYGPYSREITQTTRLLKDFGVLNVTEDDNGFGYHINEGQYFDEAEGELLIEQASLVNRLSEKSSWELELIATAHFVRRILGAHGIDNVGREKLIQEVCRVKPLYDEGAIGRAIDELAELEREYQSEPATA